MAGFALTVVLLNTLAWLAQILPAVLGPEPGSLMRGSGLLTNPVFVQDLAIWLPLLAVAARRGVAASGLGTPGHWRDAGDVRAGKRRHRQ